MPVKRRTIKVDALARVEGEGALYVRTAGKRVTDVRLRIYEPPRFFEAFLRGRAYTETPDITARICGICPVAYQMSACRAMEDACGVQVDGQIRALRRLLYCGEWIESHALHIYMLHAPDFLGYASIVEMARDHQKIVERGLALKRTGNELMRLIGGREVHPINVRVGGFYRAPSRAELDGMVDRLRQARDDAVETVRWVAGFDFPDFEQPYEFVALRRSGEYPIDDGRIVSSGGLDVAAAEYADHFVEEQVPHSNALHSRLRDGFNFNVAGESAGRRSAGGTYLVGPLARYNLNFDALSAPATSAARDAGLGPVCRNPFRSIVVRAVELVYACDEALRLIGQYEAPPRPFVDVPARRATGHGCTEAPRGILYHRYAIDENGVIVSARIVPPTSQNQAQIEADLRDVVQQSLALPDDRLTLRCEQAVRNYDPCISCATHFLRLHIDRG
ncbi:MAG TPA: Ni/Fe hydrogenase subunit alpha [bacterium]|nr:Ni/Fe hydrogenase subunit alpha [bacterium]